VLSEVSCTISYIIGMYSSFILIFSHKKTGPEGPV
jgi:hypothetical protein